MTEAFNMNVSVDKDAKELYIVIPLGGDRKDSSSGKSEIIASSHGAQKVLELGDKFRLNLNFYEVKE